MAARKRQAQTSPEDSASPDDQVLGNDEDSQYQHLMHLPHCNRSLISLTGPSFERALIARLDWWSYLRVLALIVAGYRTDAVRIVCSQVMTPRGLIGLAQDTLANSTAEIKHVFDVLSNTEVDDAATYPVLIHCTQGKDRTGLLILLLLCLAGVHQDLITGDYVKSEAELLVEFEERMEEIRVLGLDEEYTKCPSGFAGAVLGFLQEEYGGVDGYLEGLGIGKDVREGIRARLVAE